MKPSAQKSDVVIVNLKSMSDLDKFDKKFRVDPSRDIVGKFRLTKTFMDDLRGVERCFNCGDRHNFKSYPSAAWTHVQMCWKCHHINTTYVGDAQGGQYQSEINCYADNIVTDEEIKHWQSLTNEFLRAKAEIELGSRVNTYTLAATFK